MKDFTFFVQNNLVEKLTVPVAKFARKHGYKLIDVSSTSELKVDLMEVNWSEYENVLIFGSAQFMRACKESCLANSVHHNEEKFAISKWSGILKERCLNGNGVAMPLGKIRTLLDSGKMEAYHIRPDMIDKAFNGGVFDLSAWDVMMRRKEMASDLVCWVSPITEIEEECRCWIIDGVVVEMSRYRKNGEMNVERCIDDAIISVAKQLTTCYTPNSFCVMDIAKTNNSWKVIEFNPLHCSGWYAADVENILSQYVLKMKRKFKELI